MNREVQRRAHGKRAWSLVAVRPMGRLARALMAAELLALALAAGGGCATSRDCGSESCEDAHPECEAHDDCAATARCVGGQCVAGPEPTCDGEPSGAVQTRERYAAASVPYGDECLAETQTRACSAGQWQPWTGTYAAASCTVDLPAGCDATAHGATESRSCYAAASVPYGSVCSAMTQTRTCDDGTWSPDFPSCAHLSCAVSLGLSIYGDSIARGGYVGPKTDCGMAPGYSISPPPSQQVADAAAALLYEDRTVGGASYAGLLAGSMGFAAPLSSLLTTDAADYVVIRLGGNDAFMAVGDNGGVVPPDFGDVMWIRTAQAIDAIVAAGKVPVIVGVPRLGRDTVIAFYCLTDSAEVATIDAKVSAAAIADAKMREAADYKGALFIDVRTDEVPFADNDTYASDGIHPYPEASNPMSRHIGALIRESL